MQSPANTTGTSMPASADGDDVGYAAIWGDLTDSEGRAGVMKSHPGSERQDAGQKRRVRPEGFAADVLKLASGTTIAQIVVLASAPVLTRLYEPQAFGAWALFLAITGVTGVIACLGYQLAIVVAEDDDAGAALLWASSALAILSGAVVLLVCGLLPGSVLERFGGEEIAAYAPLAAFATSLWGVYNALNYWFTRTSRFGVLATTRVTSSVVTAAAQIGGGLLGAANPTMLVAGSLTGTLANTLALGTRAVAVDRRTLARSLRLTRIAEQVRRHWRFPAFTLWSELMIAVSWQVPALALGAYFTSTIVGYYALAFRVLALPMNLIGVAIGQVFYRRAAIARDAGGLDGVVRGVFSVLVNVGLVPFVVLAIAGRDIFEVAFGSPWAEAGVYAQILSIFTLVWFISTPLATLFLVLNRQGRLAWLNAVILVTRLGSFVVGGWMGNARLGVALCAVSGVLVYGYMNQYVMRLSGVPWADAWRIMGRAVLRALLPCGLVAAVVMADAASEWVLAASAIAVAASTIRAFFDGRDLLRRQGAEDREAA